MSYPQKISKYILDTLFPIRCLACNEIQDGIRNYYLCKKCIRSLELKRSFNCIGCGITSPLGQTCYSCNKTLKITRLLTVLDYNDPLAVRLIKTLKYRFVKDVSFSLEYLLKKFLITLAKEKKFNIAADNPLFVPVPLDKVRYNWRGFNQAELLAFHIGNILSLETKNILEKIKSTPPQAEIETKEDRLIAEQVFNVTDPEAAKGRHIILVDDVATTGATLNLCAKQLLENGASSVSAITIARG